MRKMFKYKCYACRGSREISRIYEEIRDREYVIILHPKLFGCFI